MTEEEVVDQNLTYHATMTECGNIEDQKNVEEPLHAEAKEFYDLLNASSQPLWFGCETHSELSLALQMLKLKSDHKISYACFDSFMEILREVAPPRARIPLNYHRTKKLVSKLGLVLEKIDCKEKPEWIGDKVWEDLCRHWSTAACKEKCEQAKRKQASDVGACVHIDGISATTTKRKMQKRTIKEPGVDEVFMQVFHNKDTHDWVSKKAKKIYDEFKFIESVQATYISNEEEDFNTQLSAQERWFQVVRGPKEDCAYGFDSSSSHHDFRASSSESASSSANNDACSSVVKRQQLEAQVKHLRMEEQQRELEFQERLQMRGEDMNSKFAQRIEQINLEQQLVRDEYFQKEEKRIEKMMRSFMTSTSRKNEQGIEKKDDGD